MDRRPTPLLALALLAAACGSRSAASPDSDPEPASEARSALPRDTAPAVGAGDVASLVAGNNAFALDLHRRLVGAGANLMTSPLSVSTALAMVWAGARGDTAAGMADALHFPLPQAQLHPAFDALDLALRTPTPCAGTCAPFTLRVANAAWVQEGAPFVPAYLDTLAVSYGAGISLLDFAGSPDAARRTINDAVARATEDRIRDLLPPGSVDGLTRFVLTNAVYFKASWAEPFDPARTAPGAFRLPDGASATVPFMHGTFATRGAALPAYDAVELRYRDSIFSMTLLAPAQGTFEAFEGALDVAGLQAVDAAMAYTAVTLSMPRFSFGWSKSLADALADMGMADAFDDRSADFTGLSTERLHLTDVFHQTFVAVDEQGTEAAAATGAIGGSTGFPSAPITVTLDRPFLFLVRDATTRQILFLGRVVDPR